MRTRVTSSEKLAREVDQPPTCDNGLVPDQKEHREPHRRPLESPSRSELRKSAEGRLINSMRRPARLAAIFYGLFSLNRDFFSL
jgi:hypothetical protein